MTAKFVIEMSTDSQYYFNLKAENGKIILTSEMYKAHPNCLYGIKSVKENSSYDFRYKRWTSGNLKYYFTLHAENGQVIGTSEMYESIINMNIGISSVKANAPYATVIDNTKSFVI